MPTHKNNHELTRTVAVREEVGRAIGQSVPAKQRNEVVQKVEEIIERYSSPYPDPNFLERIEKLSPGAAKQIIDCTVAELEHRQSMDLKQLDIHSKEIDLVSVIAKAETQSSNQGRTLGFLAYIACLVFSASTYFMGSEKLALAGFGAAAAGIIVQLIRGSSSSSVTVKTNENGKSDSAQSSKK
jgi:Predicted membrane protein (DUF2335)